MRKLTLAAMVASALALTSGCSPRRPTMDAPPVFPADANGWRPVGQMRQFGRATVFDYMNGAGEMYLAYDFRRVFVQDYQKPGAPCIVAERYQMSTSEDAYGVFSHDPEGEDVRIGQGCCYAAGLLRFWQGGCFFRILADADTAEARAAVLTLGRALAELIPNGPLPTLVRVLPADGLEATSVRYFHTQVSLNSLYYLAEANVLGLSRHSEAVMGTYRRAEDRRDKMVLLVVRYRGAQQADHAYEHFDGVFLKDRSPAARRRRIGAAEDGRHVGLLARGQFLALVFGGSSRPACERLLSEAATHF